MAMGVDNTFPSLEKMAESRSPSKKRNSTYDEFRCKCHFDAVKQCLPGAFKVTCTAVLCHKSSNGLHIMKKYMELPVRLSEGQEQICPSRQQRKWNSKLTD